MDYTEIFSYALGYAFGLCLIAGIIIGIGDMIDAK